MLWYVQTIIQWSIGECSAVIVLDFVFGSRQMGFDLSQWNWIQLYYLISDNPIRLQE